MIFSPCRRSRLFAGSVRHPDISTRCGLFSPSQDKNPNGLSPTAASDQKTKREMHLTATGSYRIFTCFPERRWYYSISFSQLQYDSALILSSTSRIKKRICKKNIKYSCFFRKNSDYLKILCYTTRVKSIAAGRAVRLPPFFRSFGGINRTAA